MKKLSFFVALLAVGLTSCSKVIDEQVAAPEQMQDFTATIAAESRTVINDANQVLWEAEDLIAIHRANTTVYYQYKVKSGAGTTDAVFGYNSLYQSCTAKATQNYAVYPYSVVTAADSDGVVSVELPATLEYASSSLANAVMVAASETTDLQFKNTQSLLRFVITSKDPAVTSLLSITVSSAANALSGAATIDLTAAEPAIVVDAAGTKSLVLSCGEGLMIGEESVELYLPVVPTEFAANDLTISIETNLGVYEKQFAQAISLNRNKITTISKTFDIEDFSGSTEDYGQVVELKQTEPEALAAELSEVLADAGVGQIILPKLQEGTEIELNNTLTFAGASTVSTASFTRSNTSLPARDLIIDGNGATLVFSGSNSRIIDVTKTCGNIDITLKNMTIVNGNSYLERGINFNTNGHLTLDNVEVKSIDSGYITYALNCPSSSKDAVLDIKNSKLTGLIALNLWGENTTANIVDSELYSVDPTTVENYSAICLCNDGTSAAKNSVINITGGKVIATDENGEPSTAISNEAIGVINIDESTEIVGACKNSVAIIDYGTTYYSFFSLQDAADYCKAQSSPLTVVLVSDIESDSKVLAVGCTMTLDLNGHNITGTDTNTSGNFELIGCNIGSNLTIINSADKTGSITLVAENNREWNSYSSVLSNQRATLTVGAGVVIEHLGGTAMAYGIDNLTNTGAEAAVTTIDGATVKSTYTAIRQFLNSSKTGVKNDLYIKSGVIESSNRAVWMQDSNAQANVGKLVISEGVQVKGNVHLSVTQGSTSWPVEIYVPNSVFVGESTVSYNANIPAGYSVVNNEGIWTIVAPEE